MAAKPRVYVETTIISYLVARPSRDLVIAAQQQVTREWWETQSDHFELFLSQLVLEEAKSGDREVTQRRLQVASDLGLIQVNDEAIQLAQALLDEGAIPPIASADALHLAIATVHEMDYLLTWNHKHLANAVLYKRVTNIIERRGAMTPSRSARQVN